MRTLFLTAALPLAACAQAPAQPEPKPLQAAASRYEYLRTHGAGADDLCAAATAAKEAAVNERAPRVEFAMWGTRAQSHCGIRAR